MNESQKEKIALFLACVLAFAISLYAVCEWAFLNSRFTTDDAAPLADPYTTSGGQSVDAVETDGSLAASSGYLVVGAQSTPVDGDLGLRLNTNAGTYLGRASFFIIVPTTLSNGIAGTANISNVFGFTDAANVQIANAFDYGFGATASQWIHFGYSDATTDINLPITPPTTSDTFYVAYIMGGGNSINAYGSGLWSSGTNPSTYDKGHFIFMKKGAGGTWHFVGRQHSDQQGGGTTRYPVVANYNSAFKLDFWGVTNDTLRDDVIGDTLLAPQHYQSMNGTIASQLFDDIPEVGAAYDSVRGNFIFNATGNRILVTGLDPGSPINWLTTANVGDDDVYFGSHIYCASGSSPAALGVVLRYNSSNSHHILVLIADGAPDNVRIFTFESGSYTQRAIDNSGVSLNVTGQTGYLWGFVYDQNDSTRIYAGWIDASGTESNPISYTCPGLFNDGVKVHGLRMGASSVANGWEDTHFRSIGTGTLNPWDSVLNCYFPTHEAPEMDMAVADGDATPSTSDSTDFGSVILGQTRSVTYTITNSGAFSLTLSGTPKVAVSGADAADFSVTTQPTSPVSASGTTTFIVRFTPSDLGVRAATLSIANDDANENPYNFSIQGTGGSSVSARRQNSFGQFHFGQRTRN